MEVAGIAVNARFRDRPITGVERYAAEITVRLPDEVVELRPSFRLPGWVGHAWEQTILPRLASGRVLWSPANTGPVMHPAQVLTIHDVGPLDHPEWYRPAFAVWYRILWLQLVRGAAHLLTVSEFSRARLLELLQLSPEKVSVVPVGVNEAVFYRRSMDEVRALRRRHALPEVYALYLGTLQPRKNLPGLLAAWQQVEAKLPGVGLVVAGESGTVFSQDQIIGRSAVRFLGRLPDADLPALYSGAAVFVQPSFYEGAGLTLLEAMACGCHIAAAGNTALPEYADTGTLLFDPHDVRGIRDALLEVVLNRFSATEWNEAGIKRAREFTWARSAAAVYEILRSQFLPPSQR